VFGFAATERGGGRVTRTRLAHRRIDCRVDGIERCDLDAGAGLHVDRDGGVALYAVEHAAGPGGAICGVAFERPTLVAARAR
jgi:hypothetical protein